MGRREKREQEVEEMKLDIINAAVQLFTAEGYENVSMRKIAQKIEYSPTAIYNYFASKEEIHQHLLSYSYRIFLNSLEEAVTKSEGSSEEERLNAVLYGYIGFGLSNPEYYQFIFIGNIDQQHQMDLPNNDRYKGFLLLMESVKRAMDSKVIKTADVQLVSQSIWASLHGITSLLIKFPGFHWANEDSLIQFHVEAILKGIQIENKVGGDMIG